jgi:hypothetical protein
MEGFPVPDSVIVCKAPTDGYKVSEPFFTPPAAGANCTDIVQVSLAGRASPVPVQLLARITKSWLDMEDPRRTEVPIRFTTVTVWGELSEPTSVVPKFNEVGWTRMTPLPVPDRATVCGAPADGVSVSEPLLAPPTVGANWTAILQEPFAARVPVQVLVEIAKPCPEMAGAIVIGRPVRLTRPIVWDELIAPRSVALKLKELGCTAMAGLPVPDSANVCGAPTDGVRVNEPVLAPLAVGANRTAIAQLLLAAIVLHALAAKSCPDMLTATVIETPVWFTTATVWYELTEPTSTAAKTNELGRRLMKGFPVPDRATVRALPFEGVSVRDPFLTPLAMGLNCTEMLHCPLLERACVQVFAETIKSGPETALVTVYVPVLLLTLTVWDALFEPMLTVPKPSELGATEICAFRGCMRIISRKKPSIIRWRSRI